MFLQELSLYRFSRTWVLNESIIGLGGMQKAKVGAKIGVGGPRRNGGSTLMEGIESLGAAPRRWIATPSVMSGDNPTKVPNAAASAPLRGSVNGSMPTMGSRTASQGKGTLLPSKSATRNERK